MNLYHGLVDIEKFKKLPPGARSLVACNPTFMPHVPDAVRERCNFCGREVWLAPSTAASVPVPNMVFLCCLPCMEAKFSESLARDVTEAQIEDLMKLTGHSRELVRARLSRIVNAHNKAQRYKRN